MSTSSSASSLLTSPKKRTGITITRPEFPQVKISEEFHIENMLRSDKENSTDKTGGFSRQYAHVYATRLWSLRSVLVQKIKDEWQQGRHPLALKKISQLCENVSEKMNTSAEDHEQHLTMQEHVTVAVIGTMFKQQPEKPSILQELMEENPMMPSKPKARYISEKDVVLLEDETTRVQLVPHEGCGITIDGVVNGVVCAVKGRPTLTGKFEVQDVIWATPSPCVWPKRNEADIEMIFVSGLILGEAVKNMGYLDLLFDYLQGLCGSPMELETSVKGKAKLFILGDSFGNVEYEKKDKNKKETDQIHGTDVAKKLDFILDQLCQTMEVYIIPGENDPAEPFFPQLPIHRCILPLSSRRTAFHSLSNPTRIHVPLSPEDTSASNSVELDMILSGGQNVVDAMRNTNISNPLEMANNLLRWGHLCPTAPDTLPLHPGMTDDIFVMKSLPHLFLVGGQPRFQVCEWKETRIVTVPRFAETGVAVLFNKSMNFVPMNFKLM